MLIYTLCKHVHDVMVEIFRLKEHRFNIRRLKPIYVSITFSENNKISQSQYTDLSSGQRKSLMKKYYNTW